MKLPALMKMIVRAALALPLLAASCAPQLEPPQNDLLVQAGFQVRPADTPERLASLRSMPPHTFVIKTVNGKPTWLFADPVACNCLYAGDQPAWDRYQREKFDQGLAMQQAQTDQLYQNIQMNPYAWHFE